MISKIIKLSLDLLFPPFCVYCKKEGDFLCADCVSRLKKKNIRLSPYKKEKDPASAHLDGVIYALDYSKNPAIKAAIKQMKYKFTEELAEEFGRLAAEKITELSMVKNRTISLIPVPLHKSRLRQRGFNQAKIISGSIIKHSGTADINMIPLLIRARDTGNQAKLGKKDRHKNLKGAFSMNKKIVHHYNPKNIYFIVDDVYTTGATLENCAKALKENSFEKIYGLVIARAF